MGDWIFFREVNWDSDMMQAHVDTRDFHVSVINEPNEKQPDLAKLVKLKDRFFHTADEVKVLIERYFTDSGGDRKWRFFCLDGYTNWFKYIRILKTDHGWLVCDSHFLAVGKDKLSTDVKKGDYY